MISVIVGIIIAYFMYSKEVFASSVLCVAGALVFDMVGSAVL